MIRTILLVEDDRGSSLLVQRTLQKRGYHVLLAGNGIEALKIVEQHPVHLIITDVVMPHMDGVDLYDALKKREDTRRIPVIIITDKQLFKDAFFALGVEHFIDKTDDINLLVEKIKNINIDLQKKEYIKVLISGNNRLVVEQMSNILIAKKYLVSMADNSLDTLQKAFLMSPHIILLDLRMSDRAQTKEIVGALRCFHCLHNIKILTYVYLSPMDLVNGDAHWQIIDNESRVCKETGGAKFIGNFNRFTFLQHFNDHVQEILV